MTLKSDIKKASGFVPRNPRFEVALKVFLKEIELYKETLGKKRDGG